MRIGRGAHKTSEADRRGLRVSAELGPGARSGPGTTISAVRENLCFRQPGPVQGRLVQWGGVAGVGDGGAGGMAGHCGDAFRWR